jgi:hypothetical protein
MPDEVLPISHIAPGNFRLSEWLRSRLTGRPDDSGDKQKLRSFRSAD